MELLVHSMLSNAAAAAMLALAVGAFGRYCRRPALIHCLWLVVLLKLITPPLLPVSLPFSLPASARTLTPARELTVLRPDNSIGGPAQRRADDRLDELQAVPESSGVVPDKAWATTTDSFLDVTDDRFAEGPGRPGLASRRELPSRTGSEDAAPTLAAPIWVIRTAAMSARVPWQIPVLFVVLAGAVAWWSLAALRVIRFQEMLKDVHSVPKELQERADELAKRLGLTRYPQVHLVPGQVPPMLWAIGGRPRVLVPLQLWLALKPDEQTSLVLHELAHLRRRDHWVRWLELLVAGLYWWHPVVWWARRALREAEEQCCDAWVVWAMPQAAKTYAAALLAALEFMSGARTAPAAASATSGSSQVSCLKRRLRMIVRARTPKGLSWIGRLAVVGMAALILPFAPSWAQDNPAKTDQTTSDRRDAVPDVKPRPDVNAPLDSRPDPALLARLARDDDDKQDDKSREAAERLEEQARDLIEKLSKEFGPVGEEVRKVLERAVGEVHKSLEKENASPDDLRKALEKSREELSRALEQGGPVDKELREAWERSRKELRDAWEKARDDIRQVVRDRVEAARQRQREQAERTREPAERTPPETLGPAAEAEARRHRQEVENARREIRQLEQQLERATRRLEELDRRESRRAQRRPATRPRAETEPARPAPAPRAEPGPAARPGQRNIRRPLVPPGAPGSQRPFGPLRSPDTERRLRNLEDKLDQLLKELKDLKSEQRPRTSATADPRVVTTVTAGESTVA